MKKRLPRIDELITIHLSGAAKLRQTWFQTLAETNVNDQPIIIGIDETGRGPIFGPMVVGGSANLTGWSMPGIKDSKLIKSERTRKALASEIQHNTIWVTAVIPVEAINQFGTLKSLVTAGQMVAAEMIRRLRAHTDRPLRVIYDGRDHPKRIEANVTFESIEKADATIFEVSCASLVAKVLHDNLVHDLVKSNPAYQRYDLDNNKGYGTAAHKAALKEFGSTDQHRIAACRTFLTDKDEDGTARKAPSEHESRPAA